MKKLKCARRVEGDFCFQFIYFHFPWLQYAFHHKWLLSKTSINSGVDTIYLIHIIKEYENLCRLYL